MYTHPLIHFKFIIFLEQLIPLKKYVYPPKENLRSDYKTFFKLYTHIECRRNLIYFRNIQKCHNTYVKDKIITSTHFSSPVTLKWKMFFFIFTFAFMMARKMGEENGGLFMTNYDICFLLRPKNFPLKLFLDDSVVYICECMNVDETKIIFDKWTFYVSSVFCVWF